MTAQCVNKGQEPIRRIDVKLNKNYLGVAATQTLPLTGDLLPGDTQIVDVALALSSEPVQTQPLNTSVQMAARSIRKKTGDVDVGQVHMFTQRVPAQIFFDVEGAKCRKLRDRQAFVSEWKRSGTEASREAMKVFEFDSERSVESPQSVLEKNGLFQVMQREIRGH